MDTSTAEISVKGRTVKVPAIRAGNVTVIILGTWIRTAVIKDESWLEGSIVGDPEAIMVRLAQGEAKADIFMFSQKVPDVEPRYGFHLEWNNVAAIPISTYADWWEKRLPQVTRKNVRRSEKRGVVVRKVEFDDTLLEGIVAINDETPIRQGRPFWHYGKSFEIVKKDYSDFLDRSEYLGAYYKDELIGFMRLINMGKFVSVLQLLGKNSHNDKRPTNALIAKAVQLCVDKGVSHLIYGQYIYGGNTTSQLTEFKRRNGFEQIFTPTYYVPLTWKGRIFIGLKLHLGLKRLIPKKVLFMLTDLRYKVYRKALAKKESAVEAAE